MNSNKYIPIIGLEVHIEPNTITKMFCGCPQDHFGKDPNSQTCPICLGLPGSLPYANEEAIYKTVKLGLAIGSKISKRSRFYRKHYFYPDLPKGFQTSQKDNPICVGGNLLGKAVNHIHLEEDSGKLIHENIEGKAFSLIDFNRSGCALIELVTEPVFHDISQVLEFVKELQLIVRYLDVSGADMEKGTMRLEANISLLDSLDSELPGYKVEIKNINSFRFLEKALKAEIERQELSLKKGEKLVQETRGYDEVKQVTYSQRTKEESHDYRYFPEADLPPIEISKSQISNLMSQIPELPATKRKRFEGQYNLPTNFIDILVEERARADYFEEAAKLNNNYKIIAGLMVNKNMDKSYPEPAGLVKKLVELTSVDYSSNSDTESAINMTIMDNKKAVSDFKNGKGEVLGFLIGKVQKILEGKGNPSSIREQLIKKIQ